MTTLSPGALAWSQDRTVVRYPDPALETIDPRFERYRIGSAMVERLWTGARWTEGPVWFGDGRFLLFSDIPNDRILRWGEETGAVTIFRGQAPERAQRYCGPLRRVDLVHRPWVWHSDEL